MLIEQSQTSNRNSSLDTLLGPFYPCLSSRMTWLVGMHNQKKNSLWMTYMRCLNKASKMRLLYCVEPYIRDNLTQCSVIIPKVMEAHFAPENV